MPCKIQIKQNLTDDIKKRSYDVLGKSLAVAESRAKDINAEYKFDVISFRQAGDYIDREIDVPQALVNQYYDNEMRLETQAQRDDAERAGEEFDTDYLFQLGEMEASKASPETINKIKEAASKMGITIQTLTDYMKANPSVDTKSANGVADLVRGVIGVAYGMEDVALTEEMVHLATAILEQTNPKLITELISKIGRFKIYNITLEAYKNNKHYQLSDGKPDIRKIKKEAVDKLIAEVIIHQSEGSTEFPELMEEEERSKIRQWWESLLDHIRNIYRKTNIDIFEQAAGKVVTGDVGGTVKDIKSGGIYLQQKNDLVDNMYSTVMDYNNRLILNPESPTDKRHYTFDLKRVAQSVTESLKSKLGKKFNRTEEEKLIDEQKRDWGSKGHKLLEQFISLCLIDKDGYKRDSPLDVEIESDLNPVVQKQIKDFAVELINSYSNGTRFLVEVKAVNTRAKGMIASTIDFMAIEPVTKKDGTPDVKVDVLDWKFVSINKTITEDIPWTKQIEWKPQMGEYTKMLYNYGLKPDQLRKARMIPFITNYENRIPGDKDSGLVPKTLEIGKLNSLEETTLYLLPVPGPAESTGNLRIDRLIKSLQEQYDKLYKKSVSPEESHLKKLQLEELSAAIRHLHLRLDFEPLYNVGRTFLNNAAKLFASFENIDYSTLSVEELKKRLGDLLEYQDSSEKYADLGDIFLSHFPKEGLSKEDKAVLSSLENLSVAAGRMVNRILNLQTEYVIHLAAKTGINLDVIENELGEKRIQADVAIDGFTKIFLEGSKLPTKFTKLISNLIMVSKSKTDLKIAKEIERFEEVLLPLEKEARSKGKSAFDLIGKVDGSELKLIKKLDKQFIADIKEAKADRNKKFLLDNMNLDAYNELSKEAIAKGEESIDASFVSSDERVAESTKEYKKTKLRQSLDITRDDFNGYDNYHFAYLFNKVMKEEGHYSKEYKEMATSDAALNAWNFFTELNDRARKMGYLNKQGASFFPLIEATMLQKWFQTKDKSVQVKDFFKDLYTARTDEGQAYSKYDPETGKIKEEIHKRFTHTDKEVSQLSRDLNKVGTLWIKSLLEYEEARNMEDVLLTLSAVDKTRGVIKLDSNKDVIFEDGVLKTDKENTTNYDISRTMINDYLYGLSEDLGSLGSVAASGTISKLSTNKEEQEKKAISLKKGLSSANTLMRALAVGLSPFIGFANWAGGQFQAFIGAGNMYRFREFTKNNWKITTGGGLSTIDKGLLHLTQALNEDVAIEQERKLAKKKSFIDYLSTWTFTDVMMVTNSAPERKLQFANALSFNDNSMVIDGKIVNIRQYLKAEDRKNRKDLSFEERRALEKSFEDRVEKLKESSSLPKIAEIKDDKVIIPGVSDEEIAKYRLKVIEYGRDLNGQMNTANKAGFRRDTILSSFMMFKTWIPKLVSVRAIGLNKNLELDEWQYGRARAFMKTWVSLCNWNIKKLRDIAIGTDEGLKLIDEMLEAKKEEYFRKTGKVLEITNEEFQDLIRKQISDQFKELGLLLGLLTMTITAKIAAPDDDDELKKNKYKYFAKLLNKATDEVSFYYDPRSADSITKGSIIPALGLFVKIERIIESLGKEVIGYTTDDEEMMDKAHPLKYFLNVVPVASQTERYLLPLLYPEVATDWGIRVSPQSRMQ